MDKVKQIDSFEGSDIRAAIENIKISVLHDFREHPFKVMNDKELFELMKSIEEEGVLVPLLARPNPNGEGLEIIAGHRRKEASKWEGIDEVPVIVKNMDDNQAIIAMIDSDLHREYIKPSERAIECNIAFVPGVPFYAINEENPNNTLRLNYTNSSTNEIEQGIAKLARLISEFSEKL